MDADPEFDGDGELPGAVLATTDQPVAIEVREIDDERVPEGLRCLGTFLDGTLVARAAVAPELIEFLDRNAVFKTPRQLVLAAREADPGLRCELYALVPLSEEMLAQFRDEADEDDAEPWAASVPSSRYDEASADAASGDEEDPEATDRTAVVMLGQIVRFTKDRKHPESLPLETLDVLERIVSGRVVEVIDKVLRDLLDG